MGWHGIPLEELESMGLSARIRTVDHCLHCPAIPAWRQSDHTAKNLWPKDSAVCESVLLLLIYGSLRRFRESVSTAHD